MELNGLVHKLINKVKDGSSFVNQNDLYPVPPSKWDYLQEKSYYDKSSTMSGLYVSDWKSNNHTSLDLHIHFEKAGQQLVSDQNYRYYIQYTAIKDNEDYVLKANRKTPNRIAIIGDNQTDIEKCSFYSILNNETIIDEPIGFDNLKVTIKRGDYHGLSAEFSETSLEFYGNAVSIIDNEYNADIDNVVTYTVTNSSNATVFTGVLDLSTYTKKIGDYTSVSCKVGEIGAKTIFNNRIDTEVDLETTTSVDGTNLTTVPTWKSIKVPIKHLAYTDLMQHTSDQTYTTGGGSYFPETGAEICQGGSLYPNLLFMSIPIGDLLINEFGTVSEISLLTTDTSDNISNSYTPDSEHTTKYGTNTSMKLSLRVHALITRKGGGWSPTPSGYIRYRLVVYDGVNGVSTSWSQVLISDFNATDRTFEIDKSISTTLLSPERCIKFYLQFSIDLGDFNALYFFFHTTLYKDSYLKMVMYDNLADPNYEASMLTVHDALNVISQAVSENALTVKSNWYGLTDSAVNATSTNGGGSLKALTNGYKIRGLFTDASNSRNTQLSFKDAIKALNALDCIGWGFETSNGTTYIRVDRWTEFYQTGSPILTITDAKEVTRTLDADSIVTNFNLGYKKYETSDEYNSIDSVHGARSFTSSIKAVSNDEEQECEFVADNYAIEETRRARTQVDASEETTYDESIFVFELHKGSDDYDIPNNQTAATGVERPAEQINIQLSPRRCAERWRSYLFSTNNANAMKFTTGEINYKTAFTCNNTSGYLEDIAAGASLAENADIAYTHAIFDAETIEFEYPLSVGQYNTIKSNPYGLISVNGLQGWIKEFSYTISTGLAKFKLIKKHV